MRYRNLLPAAVAALVIAGCGDVPPPDVPFLGHGDGYETKPDFARVEHELPLGPQELMKLTPQNVEALSQGLRNVLAEAPAFDVSSFDQ